MASKIKSINSIWATASKLGIPQERVYSTASGLGVTKLSELDEAGFEELERRLLSLPATKRETMWPDQRERIKSLRDGLGWSNEYLKSFAMNAAKIESDNMTPEKAALLISKMEKVLKEEQEKNQLRLF